MKKRILYFAGVVILVVMGVILNKGGFIGNTAGGGLNLKQLNDTTKVSVVAIADANVTNEQNLAQVTAIANFEHRFNNGFFAGADVIGTVSTEFGIMSPTLDARFGADFENFRLEAKVGKFTRNGVNTKGFDPQFSNFTIISGEGASVSNAVQLAFICNGTKVMVGHQGGEKFYNFNGGNYYVCAEQNLRNIALSGGVDFAKQTTGYAAAKWTCRNDVFTVTGNKLGAEGQNFILSYVHNNIPVCKGISMNVGSALYLQPQKTGLHLVTGFGKGRANLFAQAGGYVMDKTFKPTFGLGISYRL